MSIYISTVYIKGCYCIYISIHTYIRVSSATVPKMSEKNVSEMLSVYFILTGNVTGMRINRAWKCFVLSNSQYSCPGRCSPDNLSHPRKTAKALTSPRTKIPFPAGINRK